MGRSHDVAACEQGREKRAAAARAIAELVAWRAGADLAAIGARDRLGGKLMHLNVDRQRIKDAPPYDPSITVDGAYEEKFLTY